jgi:catechol 2,3-dioxygenase-like lactoylglutathione lyase family enzyme
MHEALTILYVKDQEMSAAFYEKVLLCKPRLHVPGMTEFQLTQGAVLGIMPEAGIKRLLGESLPDPAAAAGIPRAEIYLVVDDPDAYHARAIENGARELDGLAPRDWGHRVAYSLDADGHVLAFGSVIPNVR